MRKLVLILIVFIAVVTFIRALDNSVDQSKRTAQKIELNNKN